MAKYCPYCVSRIDHGNSCPYCTYIATYRPKEHHLRPGTLLNNKYLVGRVLGEGGFGITYLGRDLTLDMKVAIKEYYPNRMVGRTTSVSTMVSLFDWTFSEGFQAGKEQFIREAQTIAKLDKESAVVTVRDFFEQNNSAYIVMEFVEGDNLETIMRKTGKTMEPKELFPLLEPLFAAMDDLHEIGLIHRDISPDNIMIENGRARLIDFGCARDTMVSGSETDAVLKHGFSPVEQYQNRDMGPWSDVYAMAATIYFCLTGKMVPRATERSRDTDLPAPSSFGVKLSPKQERALMKALSIRREDRYQSMGEFGKDLFLHRNWYQVVAIAAGAVAVLALAAFLVFDPGSRVEQMPVKNKVYETLTLEDSLSEDEKTAINQMIELMSRASIRKSQDSYSTESTLMMTNSSDCDYESMWLVFHPYSADGALLGSGTMSSIQDFKKGSNVRVSVYLPGDVERCTRLTAKAVFTRGEKRYSTPYIEIDYDRPAEGPADFTMRVTNDLPCQIRYINWNGVVSTYLIDTAAVSATDIGNGYSVTVTLSGSYESGPDKSSCYTEYRVTDEDGAVFQTGTVSFPMMSPGERFDNVKISLYSVPAGEYAIELLDRDMRS